MDSDTQQFLASALFIPARLDNAEATQIARALRRRVGAGDGFRHPNFVGIGMSSVSARLDNAEVTQIAQALATTLEREMNSNVRGFLASALSSVSARLDNPEAARVCEPAAQGVGRFT